MTPGKIYADFRTAYEKVCAAERFCIFLSVGVFVVLACWAIFFVPMNNDEANNYHILSCLTNSYAQVGAHFQECDQSFDLLTPFGFTLHRSNSYYGMTASVLYAPIFFLFHFQVAQYVFGLVCFALFCVMMARLTKKPFRSFPILLSFFPFVFNFIHDMGPVHNAMLMFPVGVWGLRRIATTQGASAYAYAGLLALLMTIGIEEKAFFIYLIPSLCFFMMAFIGADDQSFRILLFKSWRPLFFGAMLFLGLTAALFFSVKVAEPYDGLYFVNWLRIMGDNSSGALPHYDMVNVPSVEKWPRFLLFWPAYAGRFFVTDLTDAFGNRIIPLRDFFALCLLPASLFLTSIGSYAALGGKKMVGYPPYRPTFLLLSFLAFFATFTLLGSVWAGHHFVFLWIPLIILFCDYLACLKGREIVFVSVLFAAANLVPALWLSQTNLRYEVSRERDAIGAYFSEERSGHAVIDYEAWGYQFIQRDYGHDNQMVFLNALASYKNAQKLSAILGDTGRNLYVVCRLHDPSNSYESQAADSCAVPYIEGAVRCRLNKQATAVNVLPDLKIWHVFKITFGDNIGSNADDYVSNEFKSRRCISGVALGFKIQNLKPVSKPPYSFSH